MDGNHGIVPEPRADPFGLGLTAHRNLSAREACPFPIALVVARCWLAGWVHGDIGAATPTPERSPVRRERPWSRGELIVLITLVRSGETLAGLAARLGRSKTAIRQRCALEKLELTEAQELS